MFDYSRLRQQMERLAQTASDRPEALPEELSAFLQDEPRLPPECAEAIFWGLSRDLDFSGLVRCFDWYTLCDAYQKLAAEHADMPRVLLAYRQRHPAVESEELADFLWFAQLYRLAVQNAWQLANTERLELFRGFVENMTIYALHTIQPEAWNGQDIALFPPELRMTFHVNQAYACLEQDDLEGYVQALDLAGADCPDLHSCTEALKVLPTRTRSPLEDMSQAEVQAYALRCVSEIKAAFQSEDWLKTAELIKQFDREGFEASTDFELLRIQCQLAERGLLW